ncbi:MAG: amino acid carrier protein [Chlamydiales bacterium]|nr:amino acid carrier protein [Chlamydiales bacterium]
MLDLFFSSLDLIDDYLWSYIGFPLIMGLGIYLSFKARFVQIRRFPDAVRIFVSMMREKNPTPGGVHPIKAFFACIGGCIGIGNVVGVCTAVQIGGPGAMFWVWITALVGMILKYAELYVGMKYREQRPDGGFNGGPMYFLPKVLKYSWVPGLVSLLLCVYGVEVFQFRVMTNSVSENFGLNHIAVTLVFLVLVLWASRGGVALVGTICSYIVPIFFVCYLGMGIWVCIQNYHVIPQVLADVVYYAFAPHAAVGGIMGGIIITISQGIRRGCYSSDVGVGYASIIHSESGTHAPERQASLAIMDIFFDAFLICTMSMTIILVTGTWVEPIDAMMLVQESLGMYFPYMNIFMPTFLVLLGYSTVIAFYCVGLKCAEFLGGKKGTRIFNVYAAVTLFLFSFVDTRHTLVVMSITQLLLVVINLWGIYKLRNEINYEFSADAVGSEVQEAAQ